MSNGGAGSADARLRQQLLENNNLHTILDLPAGVFTAGVKTVVLFFTKGEPTQKIWYYQLNLNRNLGKTNPLNEQDLAEFVELQKLALSGAEGAADSENSWSINIADIDPNTFDLSVKNPNKKPETTLRDPQDILIEIQSLDSQSQEILQGIKELL